MHTTHCAEVVPFRDLANLPPDAAGLFAAPDVDLFASAAWYHTIQAHGMAPGAEACFLLCRVSGKAVALFPLSVMADEGALTGQTTLYTCRYHPLLAADASPAELGTAFSGFARFCHAWPTARLDALPADWPQLATLTDTAQAAGLAARQFDHFGNWHEPVAGQTWQSYLAARPGPLRTTIGRKLRRNERDTTSRFDLVSGGAELEVGIAAFEAVYCRSWKEAEPFPHFNTGLMREIAPCRMLRLGILRFAGEPVAAQLWVVEHDRATVLKLAHDEAYKPASPGTVLTALMLRHLLDEEHVAEIDFGRGDDEYKSGWARLRRQRIGVVLANPWRLRGLMFLGRHAMGRVRAAMRQTSGGTR